MSKLLLKGGRLLDPRAGVDRVADVLITDTVIAAIGEDLTDPAARVVDCRGLVVTPGFIDLHVHLREPGEEWKEDIASGTRAAARGGFVAVCAVPNTRPVIDNAALVRFVVEKAAREAAVKVWPYGAVTKGQKGEELAELGEMAAAGAVGFTDDGHPIERAEVMRLALLYARQFGRPVLDHAEDRSLSQDGAMHYGRFSTLAGLRGYDPLAEEVHVARDVLLAEATGGHVHIMHVSTARSVEIIRQAKARGVRVTAEVTPHHLALTDEDVAGSGYDTNFKMNPPLRSAEDREALIAGLADGTIDCVATDHAPHHRDDKEVEFGLAKNGVVGLETAVGVVLDALVRTGRLSLERMILAMSTRPAEVLGLRPPSLRVGAEADVTVLDLEKRWIVRAEDMVSRSRNSPFLGRELVGAPAATVVSGRLVMEGGRLVGW
ncbi:dihydroorotase [Caldinitratiruptor microaerophilus]|uniref:Dihydroorotase n=1 Tax=Caldinitratiruptor microaerophilus TaxID=671077 RepID=A0AA35CJX8_9FIRM|nr:dihydroorotase [Caldinitratiruptor microaerophilus]BDG60689.1 dihydroorotase [Caldinitratiruptor microaerophilus]